MSNPKCSIVIATYNKADLLDLSLRSIRQQNVPFDYEIIVVDDGSRDHTPQVCKKYDVHYAYLNRPYYTNPAAARNVGLKLAKADVIIQQCEVIHDTRDVIEKLTLRASSRTIDFAAVYNARLDSRGEPTPKAQPFAKVIAGTCYTGPHNTRPLFFLGAAVREDLFAVGGHDESFTMPGYEDNWLADCLIHGRGCMVRSWGDILGWHLDHPRPQWSEMGQAEMKSLYDAKVAAKVFTAASGPWLFAPLANEEKSRAG